MAKLVEFEVIRTSINDGSGVRRMPGDKVMLGKELAKHYIDAGYVRVPIANLFGEDDDTTAEAGSNSADDTQKASSKRASKPTGRKSSSRATQAALDEAEGGRSN